MDDQKATLTTIEAVEAADDPKPVMDHLLRFGQRFGFESVAVVQLVNPVLVGKRHLVLTTWPEEFIQRRKEQRFFTRDPVVRYAQRSKQPFTWSAAIAHADKYGRMIADETRDYTQHDGMMFPIHAYDSIPGAVSMGTRHLDISPTQVRMVDLVCVHAYSKLSSLIGPFPYELKASLTSREIEVIQYAAAGKSNWEVSRILGLSEHTVADYLRSISRKLGTSGRTHTVAMAIAQGHIMA